MSAACGDVARCLDPQQNILRHYPLPSTTVMAAKPGSISTSKPLPKIGNKLNLKINLQPIQVQGKAYRDVVSPGLSPKSEPEVRGDVQPAAEEVPIQSEVAKAANTQIATEGPSKAGIRPLFGPTAGVDTPVRSADEPVPAKPIGRSQQRSVSSATGSSHPRPGQRPFTPKTDQPSVAPPTIG